MSGKEKAIIAAAALAVLIGLGYGAYRVVFDVKTVREYRDPEAPRDEVFADDPVPGKPPAFDPTLVDSRKLAGWEVNSSAAVLRLDCPPLRPGEDQALERLHFSYAWAARAGGPDVLPSVNLIDGKAKQFDDGLYAAVDLAAFRGIEKRLAGCTDIVKRLAANVKTDSTASDYLKATLELAAGMNAAPSADCLPKAGPPKGPPTKSQGMLAEFFARETDCKPIGFYTWSKELQALFRAERFLAQELKPEVAADLAAALRSDPQLLADYKKFVGLFRGLTNPLACLSLDELPEGKLTKEIVEAEAAKRGVRHASASFLPPSTSRENELFERLDLSSGSDLMRELIKRIKSGEVDLKPGKNAGWYDYQVYALETLLVPAKGQEKDKLVLSARYKQRMKEAFEALLSKRRETHVRMIGVGAAPPEPSMCRPRLRVEPAPTYFLRTARAYAFLDTFLKAALGKEALRDLTGLRLKEVPGEYQNAKLLMREEPLAAELPRMRDLFYGCYLVSCEDLGLKPALMEGELADPAAAKLGAENWLENFARDPDLAADVRVAVPVYVDEGGTELWATLGVRLARLKAEYVHGPKIREPGGEWQSAPAWESAEYLIPVDTFVSFRLKGNRVLDRAELRKLIEEAGSRDKFLELVKKL